VQFYDQTLNYLDSDVSHLVPGDIIRGPKRRRTEVQHDDDSRYYRSHRLYFDRLRRPTRLMNPLVEFIVLTGTPFLIGLLIGYSLRSYISVMRRSRAGR
jgi:hypothetical protein